MTHGIASGFTDQGELTYDNLIAGEFPRFAHTVTVTGDTPLKRGAVLGRVTADDSYQLSLSAANDGSESPTAILAEDIDPQGAEVDAVVYFSGEFNELAVSLGEGHTIDSIRPVFRDRSIFLHKNLPV